MIIPVLCKSCGKPIGHLWFRYQEKLKKYRKEAEAKAEAGGLPRRTPEARALDELLVHKYCCRLNFLCQPDLVDMIKNRVE